MVTNRTVRGMAALAVTAAMIVAAPAAEQEKQMTAAPEQYSARLLDADQLIGANVTNPQGESLGEIRDVVLNAQRDRVSYVAVGYGGLLGIGEKHLAVPFNALTIDSPRRDQIDKVTLNVSKSEFEASEGFDTDRWPSHGNVRWQRPGPQEQSTLERAGEQVQQALDEGRDEPQVAVHDIQFRRLTGLTGLPVKNLQGQDLGDIEDVVLDLREGRPVYGVIGFGGFLGLGEKLAAVPWSAVDVLPRLETARIDAGKDVLEAIAYEQASPPELAQLDQAQRLHERFNEEPYWQTFGYVEPTGKPSRGVSPEAWKAGSEYNANFNSQAIVTTQGTIANVGTFRPGPNAAPGLRLRIQTEQGQTSTVYAGPRDYAARQGVRFNYGDRIEVTGSKTTVQGRPVIIATRISSGDKTLELRDGTGQPKWSDEDLK